MILEGRIVAAWALVGSHNYNLADETSDRDYKAFVYPTFEDIYHNKRISKAYVGVENIFEPSYGGLIDYEVHDLRRMPELFKKVNINFLEVLFSTSDFMKPEVRDCFKHVREFYCKAYPARFFKACMGVYNNKMKLLNQGTAGTQHLMDKYGYDTKQALHAYRNLWVIAKYFTNGNNFAEALVVSDPVRKIFLDLKNGSMKEFQFRLKADQLMAELLPLLPKLEEQTQDNLILNGIAVADKMLEFHIRDVVMFGESK